jgi:diguanylate cyclase (GGDEF)-like protein/PAS domain S-box-containing protein
MTNQDSSAASWVSPGSATDASASALAAIVDGSDDAIIATDPGGHVRSANHSVSAVFDCDADDLVGQDLAVLFPTDQRAELRSVMAAILGGGSQHMLTTTRVRRDGSSMHASVRLSPVRAANGVPVGIMVIARDVTAEVTHRSTLGASEARVREEQGRYQVLADTALEGIWAADSAGRTVFANTRLAEILGVSVDILYAGRAAELLGGADDLAFTVEKLAGPSDAGAEQQEVTYPHPDGQPRVLRLSVSALPDATRAGSIVMVTDISDQRSAEQELRRRGLYDELTGLPNRSLLADRLTRAVTRSRHAGGTPVAVLFADLDQFKLINDSWGHDAGDRLLVAVAERLTTVLEPSDTLARFASDEFVVVREGACEAEAEELANKLVRVLADPFDLAGQRCYVSASVGVAVSPPSPGEELLRFADAAMYDAKARGRGRVQRFDLSLADEANGQLALSNDLRDALAREALALHYQPLVELATGRVLGVEALARWDHPTRGPVSPMLFVALAAATGLAPMLDQWALRRACLDLGQLRAATHPSLRVAVNLSATHLADADLEQTVLSTLQASGLDCSDLGLEITESAIMDNPEYARDLLERLRARGMSIAIDDFGTGYSSLGYLSRLPATTVKIDRSFIHNITEDPDSLAVVASIIDLCRAMSLTTVAEGIETVEQLTLLHRLGCNGGQGFLWSPALPLDQFTQRLAHLPHGRFDVTRSPTPLPPSGALRFDQAPTSDTAPMHPRTPPADPPLGLAGTGLPLVWGPVFAAALSAARLSTRELEIVTRLARGKRVPAIAAELFLSQGTVRNQLSSVYRKLRVRSQQELLDMIHSGAPSEQAPAARP